MREKIKISDEKGASFSDAAMALLGILELILIMYVFRMVRLAIANGTLFWSV